MLGKFKCSCFSSGDYHSFVLFFLIFIYSSLSATIHSSIYSLTQNANIPFLSFDPKFEIYPFLEWQSSLKEKTFEESIEVVFSIREELIQRGYQMPLLSEVCLQMEGYLTTNNVNFERGLFEKIYLVICSIEQGKGSDGVKIELSGKMVTGFVKILVGGLMLLVPEPTIKMIGGGLVISGVTDICDETAIKGDQNGIEQKNRQMELDRHKKINNEIEDKSRSFTMHCPLFFWN